MANKNSYFDNDSDIQRRKRRKKKKQKKALKSFLTVLGLIVVAMATFIITVKISNPNADLKALVPKQIAQFVDKPTTTEPETTAASATETTAPTTTAQSTAKPNSAETPEEILDYLDFSEFDFNTSIQGNYLGNLFNGGLVGTDMTYEYHIVSGKGIYRFNPTTEDYTCYYKSTDELSSLNLRGDYIYFVNDDNGNLCKLKKGESKPKVLAGEVKFAYVYDSTVYYVTKTNSLCIMDVADQNPEVLYTSSAGAMRLAGISLNRVFFTVSDDNKNIHYYCIDNQGEDLFCFRESTTDSEIVKLYLENGFMYYYQKQDNGSYNLCRQKFGSENVVTLVKGITTESFAVVDMNKLFFGMTEDGKYKVNELNMNTDEEKTMLTITSAGEKNSLKLYHGAEYDFVIGEKADGTGVYSASSMLTSSTNVMKFSGSSWSY